MEEPPLHVVLVSPQIPQNTGNVGRLCAVTGVRLHLVHPLGFRITDAKLKRAGLDYWYSLDVHHHASWSDFRASRAGPRRLWLIETGQPRTLWEARFERGDGLVFGSETDGVPPEVAAELGREWGVTIPHGNAALRSLNLSTSVGVAAYEALRQAGFAGSAPGATRSPAG